MINKQERKKQKQTTLGELQLAIVYFLFFGFVLFLFFCNRVPETGYIIQERSVQLLVVNIKFTQLHLGVFCCFSTWQKAEREWKTQADFRYGCDTLHQLSPHQPCRAQKHSPL